MTAFAFTLIVLALTVYGLQRNHARNGHPRVAGSVDVDDRTRADLRVTAVARPRDASGVKIRQDSSGARARRGGAAPAGLRRSFP